MYEWNCNVQIYFTLIWKIRIYHKRYFEISQILIHSRNANKMIIISCVGIELDNWRPGLGVPDFIYPPEFLCFRESIMSDINISIISELCRDYKFAKHQIPPSRDKYRINLTNAYQLQIHLTIRRNQSIFVISIGKFTSHIIMGVIPMIMCNVWLLYIMPLGFLCHGMIFG